MARQPPGAKAADSSRGGPDRSVGHRARTGRAGGAGRVPARPGPGHVRVLASLGRGGGPGRLAGHRSAAGCLAAIRQIRRAAAIRLALAAVAGLGLNLALFEAFARLPVAVAVAAFGCYPLFVAAWEAARGQSTAGVAGLGLAVVAIIGLVLLMRPDPSVSVPAAGLLLALLAAVLHASYILLGRGGWGEVGDSAAAFLIVATGAAGLGAMTTVTRPSAVLAPVTDFGLTGLLLFEGALAGAAAPCYSWLACGASEQPRPRCCRCANPSPRRCSPR